MCKNCPDCKACKEKFSRSKRNTSDNPMAKSSLTVAAATAGAYYIGSQNLDYFDVSKEAAMKQALLVGGVEVAQEAINNIIDSAAPSVRGTIASLPAAASVETGIIYTLGSEYLVQVDNRPMLTKFLHAAGASFVGRAAVESLGM